MKHFLLTYDTAPDYLERRPQYRDAHLALACAAAERGELLLGGAVDGGAGGAMLLFAGEDDAAAKAFAAADPYVGNGLVTGWTIREWNTVVGPAAATPVHPG